MACPAINDGAFLASVLAHVDCQAATLGEGGWRALSGSSVLLGTALTLFVALFGYRLLLGERLMMRDGVLAAIKVGVVLLLATSWPAFRTLAYDVALRGPAELAATIGAPADLPGSDGSLAGRLQGIDDLLAELALIGSGRPPGAAIAGSGIVQSPEEQAAELQRLQRQAQRRPWDPAREFSLIDSARLLFLAATLGAVASVRLLAGLLLALAPLFALFLLFDRTRGLFEGWIRGLVGAALATVATSIVLGVELALVGPWLAEVVALRRAEVATPSAPVEILALTLIFAIALIAVLVGAGKVARGFRFPDDAVAAPGAVAGASRNEMSSVRKAGGGEPIDARAGRSRAMAVADAVTHAQRREAGLATGIAATSETATGPTRAFAVTMRAGEEQGGGQVVPLGRSFRRRTRSRVSALASRRDGR